MKYNIAVFFVMGFFLVLFFKNDLYKNSNKFHKAKIEKKDENIDIENNIENFQKIQKTTTLKIFKKILKLKTLKNILSKNFLLQELSMTIILIHCMKSNLMILLLFLLLKKSLGLINVLLWVNKYQCWNSSNILN
jgi:hypothetical protein